MQETNVGKFDIYPINLIAAFKWIKNGSLI